MLLGTNLVSNKSLSIFSSFKIVNHMKKWCTTFLRCVVQLTIWVDSVCMWYIIPRYSAIPYLVIMMCNHTEGSNRSWGMEIVLNSLSMFYHTANYSKIAEMSVWETKGARV